MTCSRCGSDTLQLYRGAEWGPYPGERPEVDGWVYCPECERPVEDGGQP